MLTFFRRIRKGLFSDGATSKYFLYAIGEIALVVIGILIALQINNWNQYSKDEALAKEYLYRIKADIVKDTSVFNSIIKRNLDLRERIKESMVKMYSKFDNRDQVIEVMAVYDEGLNNVFVSNNNTYTDLLSTGNLRLIKNIELKDVIVSLYSHYEEKKKLMDSDKNWMDGIAINMDSNVNFIKFSNEIIDIFTQPEMLSDEEWVFMNDQKSIEFHYVIRAFSSIAWSLSVSNDYYNELILSCNDALSAINEEISK